MSRRHLSKYARLRLDLQDAIQRANDAERTAYYKFRERYDIETAMIQAENNHRMKLITDYVALQPMHIIFPDKAKTT